ncbi:hypothetical protein IFM89_032715 [Coptis chinensis]|uniref:Uncharacterized protein n=1 Tax=Coptis chinensis TaxID=261450 RepID=A0A835IDE5_9MAGN|nr:hypothetical protein IFM89_032715 [Coptis chinensis]
MLMTKTTKTCLIRVMELEIQHLLFVLQRHASTNDIKILILIQLFATAEVSKSNFFCMHPFMAVLGVDTVIAQEGVTEHITAVHFSPEGATEKLSSEGATENIPTEGAAEKSPLDARTKVVNDKLDGRIATSVVEHELNHQAACEVVDTALSETEASLDEVTATLAKNGAKVTAAAASLLSTVAGIPASLLQKELAPNIVPNFRSNNGEAVGLQVLNTPPKQPCGNKDHASRRRLRETEILPTSKLKQNSARPKHSSRDCELLRATSCKTKSPSRIS